MEGPHPFDHAGKKRRAVQVGADDGVGGRIGVGQIAHRLVFRRRGRLEGEGHGLRVPRLELHFGIIHAPGVDSGRRAGFKAAQAHPQRPQAVRQGQRGREAVRAGGARHVPHDGAPAQIGARGHHHGAHPVYRPVAGAHGAHRAVLGVDVGDLRLLEAQVFLPLQGVLHDLLIPPAVGLGPQGPHRRALAPVERAVLDAGRVGGPGHLAAQGVQLPHQVALAGAADGGIAGHVAHRVQIDGKDNGLQPQPGSCQGRLDPGVTGTHYRDVKLSSVKFGHGIILCAESVRQPPAG